jgi:hypothetical protein
MVRARTREQDEVRGNKVEPIFCSRVPESGPNLAVEDKKISAAPCAPFSG